MAFQPGPIHARHLGMGLQEVCDTGRAVGAAVHAQAQGAQAAHQQPGIVRGGGGAQGHELLRHHLPDVRLRSRQHARHHVAVAVQVLGGAVGHQVDAVFDRPLEERAVEAVVAEGEHALLLRDRGHGGEVLQLEGERVGALEDEEARVVPAGTAVVLGVGAVHVGHLHPEAREQLVQQLPRPAVGLPHAHHMVAGLYEGDHRSGDGGASAAEDQGVLRAFQGGHLFAEHGHRRVVATGVQGAVELLLHGLAHGGHRGVAEVPALEHRRHHGVHQRVAVLAQMVQDVVQVHAQGTSRLKKWKPLRAPISRNPPMARVSSTAVTLHTRYTGRSMSPWNSHSSSQARRSVTGGLRV